MLTKEVIILKQAGLQVPDAYLEAVLKEKPSFGGVAVCPTSGTLLADSTKDPDLAWAKSIQAPGELLDNTILFYLGHDRQPFPLLSDGKNVLISAFLEGDFSKFAEVESKHSEHYLAVEKYFKPKVSELYELLGKDLGKLVEYLQKSTIATDFGSQFKDSGSIILMAATTDILTYADNKEGGEFSWGATTNTFGYSEEKVAPASTKITTHEGPPRELTFKERAHAAKVAAGLIPADTPAPNEAKPAEAPKEPDKITEPAKPGPGHNVPNMEPDKDGYLSSESLMFKFNLPAPAAGNRWAAPPINSNRSDKKAWYSKRKVTFSNLDWKAGEPIQIPLTAMGAAIVEAKAKAPLSTATAVPTKVDLPASVPQVKTDKKDDVVSDPPSTIPVLPTKLREHIVDNYLKQPKIKALLDADGEEMLDPKTYPDIEKDFPNIINELGLKNWGQLYRLFDYPECENISKKYPPLCALLAFWALHKCRGLEIQIAKGEPIKDTSTKNLPATSTETAPPAPRKSAFGRR